MMQSKGRKRTVYGPPIIGALPEEVRVEQLS